MKKLSDQTTYTCFVILGKTEQEEERLYGMNQWMELFKLIDPFFESQELYASVVSYQIMLQLKKIDKKGAWHVRAKKIPTGGVHKWSLKANQKICTQQMDAHFELLKDLATKKLTLQEYIESKFPEVDSYFDFNETQVYAYLDADINVKHQPQGDFHFYLRKSLYPNNKWNQEVSILLSDRLLEKCGAEAEEMLRKSASIAHSVQIAKADFRCSKNIKTEYGVDAKVAVFGRRYGQDNSLELRVYDDLQLSPWGKL